eukprot:RCo046760
MMTRGFGGRGATQSTSKNKEDTVRRQVYIALWPPAFTLLCRQPSPTPAALPSNENRAPFSSQVPLSSFLPRSLLPGQPSFRVPFHSLSLCYFHSHQHRVQGAFRGRRASYAFSRISELTATGDSAGGPREIETRALWPPAVGSTRAREPVRPSTAPSAFH